ncbi:hypothetical protein TNCV_938361 [Trichonephila clavipes]|nr:hypothetical protein TNCV_938361 [Trichonephila clavipes]
MDSAIFGTSDTVNASGVADGTVDDVLGSVPGFWLRNLRRGSDIVIQVLIESSAMEHLLAIHPGMIAERAGLVSSQTRQWRYTPKKSCPVVRRMQATASAVYRSLEVGPTVARVSHGFPWLLVFGSRQYICQCMWI